MNFEKIGLKGFKASLDRLDDLMKEYGFIREGQWDYERVTYDRKFQLKDGIFYLRVQGYAIDGDVGANKATIQLITPILGKHYYPHGVEYGDDENFPTALVEQCEKILTDIKNKITQLA